VEALVQSTSNTSGKPLNVELTAEEMNGLFVLGRELYEREDFLRAGDVLRLLVLVEPLHVEGWQVLGACHEQLEEFAVASQMYETGCRLGGNEPRLGLLAARAAIRDGDVGAAREWLAEIACWELDAELDLAMSALRSAIEGDS
jgi:Flp pilus assembly protein TadD